MFSLILTIAGIAIFSIYITALLITVNKDGDKFPPSLSDSFYIFNKKMYPSGYAFTFMMFTVALILNMGWLEMNDSFEDWRRNLTVLPFFCTGAIMFVGAAPMFRSGGMEQVVHETSAYVAAGLAILWDILQNCSSADWWLIPVSLGIGVIVPFIVGYSTKTMTKQTSLNFHLEMMAFISIFISSFAHCVMNVL